MSEIRDQAPPWMHTVSATEFVRQYAKWSEMARMTPVVIHRHGVPGLAVMAFAEWRRIDDQNRQLWHELRYLRALCSMGGWSLDEQTLAQQIADDGVDQPSQWYHRMRERTHRTDRS